MVRYNPQAISFIRNNYINEQLRKRYGLRNSACREHRVFFTCAQRE